VRVNWQHISKAVVAALEGVTLADMVKPRVFHHGTKIPLRVALS
jgi:DNA-binding IscR family transcriptional regulator